MKSWFGLGFPGYAVVIAHGLSGNRDIAASCTPDLDIEKLRNRHKKTTSISSWFFRVYAIWEIWVMIVLINGSLSL
ncbi:hypothetical protein FPL17_15445 [Acinetobacter dispersus]|nr:hypothetical protein FPL17_15445 [Acinetobacter dispersus]